MRAKHLILCVAVVLGLVAVPITWNLVANRPGVSLSNFQRMHKGMSRQEVEAIMGRAANDGFADTQTESSWVTWESNEAHVLIVFRDNNGRAIQGCATSRNGKCFGSLSEPPSPVHTRVLQMPGISNGK